MEQGKEGEEQEIDRRKKAYEAAGGGVWTAPPHVLPW